jgi:hypothetical protein
MSYFVLERVVTDAWMEGTVGRSFNALNKFDRKQRAETKDYGAGQICVRRGVQHSLR